MTLFRNDRAEATTFLTYRTGGGGKGYSDDSNTTIISVRVEPDGSGFFDQSIGMIGTVFPAGTEGMVTLI